MSRCAFQTWARLAACALSLLAVSAQAQTFGPRPFPQQALRGELVITAPPQARLNGRDVLLAPGSRIRAQDNLLVLSGQLVGQKLLVTYTQDQTGNLQDIWVMRPEEAKRRWPSTPKEAANWSFDPNSSTWLKP